MNNYKCVIASEEMINKKWNQEIEKHEDKELWGKNLKNHHLEI